MIMNPYYRHKNIQQAAQRKLEGISLVSPIAPSSPLVDKDLISAYIVKLTEFHKQVDEQAMYAMLVVIESAFRAEAFLNMVHAICLKSENRLTKKALKQVLIKKWKNKVKDMPDKCNFITKKPDLDDSRLISIEELFNQRNRIAHSYPCPENMSVGEMYFAGDYPVLNCAVSYIDFAYTLNNQIPSADDARSALKAVKGFEEYLKELLDSSALAAVELFAKIAACWLQP